MIVYDLSCVQGHRFEGWFRSSSDFERQMDATVVACPHCGSNEVRKGISAPNLAKCGSAHVSGASEAETSDASLANDVFADMATSQAMNKVDLPPALRAQLQEAFAKVRKHVESTYDYVGDQFAEEARRIHYGETDDRKIYGEATYMETEELLEEGIEVMPLPAGPRKSDA